MDCSKEKTDILYSLLTTGPSLCQNREEEDAGKTSSPPQPHVPSSLVSTPALSHKTRNVLGDHLPPFANCPSPPSAEFTESWFYSKVLRRSQPHRSALKYLWFQSSGGNVSLGAKHTSSLPPGTEKALHKCQFPSFLLGPTLKPPF